MSGLIDTSAKKTHWLDVWSKLSQEEKDGLESLTHLEDLKEAIEYCKTELGE